MKIRAGFVSNSSSSSFMCEVCNEMFSGWDASLSEFECAECEHGHTFCQKHAEIPDDYYDKNEDFPYSVDADYCPICSLKNVPDKYVLEYLLKINSVSKDEMVKEIQKLYKNFKELKGFLKQ